MAAAIQEMFRSLSFAASWTVIAARREKSRDPCPTCAQFLVCVIFANCWVSCGWTLSHFCNGCHLKLASCVVVSLRRLPLCSQGWQKMQENGTLQCT